MVTSKELFPGYIVYSDGRVWSERTQRFLTGGNSRGYINVLLMIDGKAKSFGLHRLVAMAFIPNPDNLPEVNHKDENKLNNDVSNLEWCSHRYNSTYGTAVKRMVNTRLSPAKAKRQETFEKYVKEHRIKQKQYSYEYYAKNKNRH